MVDLQTYMQTYLSSDVNVYTMDHRGTGRSTLLDCVAAQATTTGSPEGSSVSVDEVPDCAAALEAQYGSDLASFSVTSAATDIATFISTFTPGATTIVYGVSYGTALVERLIHLETPEVVGYVLDGIATSSGSELSKFENFSTWDEDFGQVADGFLTQCAADATCNGKFDSESLPATLVSLVDAFDKDPNSTCAALVRDVGGVDPPSYGLRMTLGSLFMDASTRTLIPVMAYRLTRCRDEDVPVLTHLLKALNADAAYTSEDSAFESTLLYDLIVFSEMWESPEPSEETMLARFTNYTVTSGGTFGSVASYCAFSKEQSPVCDALGVANYSAGPIVYARDEYWNVAATIPAQASVLLLSSKLDPQTPHKYAEALFEALNGSAKALVTFEHATHGTLWTTPLSDASPLTCGLELLGSYVSVSGDLSRLDSSCVSAMPAISFDVPTAYLHAYLSTSDAYDGEFDASLSSSSSGSSTASNGNGGTSYRTEFILFVALFSVMLLVCGVLGYRYYLSKQQQCAKHLDAGELGTPDAVTPTNTADFEHRA